MKTIVLTLSIGLGLAATARAHAQQPVYVANSEACISVRSTNDGGKSFFSNCSSRIFIAAYANGNLQFDGYHYAGHIDDIPGNAGSSYKYFACPAEALPMDGGDPAMPADGNSSSYRCQTMASGGHQ